MTTESPPVQTKPGLSSKLFWALWALGFVVWVGSLIIASPYDLQVSIAIADSHAPFARFISRFGEWPSWIIVIIALGMLLVKPKLGSRLYQYKTACVGIILQALIHPLLITQSIKFFWGRVRFVSLLPDYSNYTPFYIPAGPFISESLPSGHVAMAFALTPLIFYFARIGSRKTFALVTTVVLIYGLMVAFGRILAGAHYLTDCIFSTGSSFLVAAVVMRLLLNRQKTAART